MPTDETKEEKPKSAKQEERRSSQTVVSPKVDIKPKKVVGGKWL